MGNHLAKRLLSLMLAVVLVCGLVIPAHAVENGSEQSNKQDLAFEKVDNSGVSASKLDGLNVDDPAQLSAAEYSANDVVRVSIVLEDPSTLEAGFSTAGIASNGAALSYRVALKANQEEVTSAINAAIGRKIDVKWNLTLAANIISANVSYGQIEAIKEVPGVKNVILENRYEPDVVDTDLADDPNMATSSVQIGSASAWAAGYTGAGSRVAIIDTGIDVDHQSFDASGFNYSLAYRAGLKNVGVDEYIASLDLLDQAEIEGVLDQLNIAGQKNATAAELYKDTKIPFGYNYVDDNNDIQHKSDDEHGAHVAGIAAANAFIPNGDGTFSHALESVFVQGVAPDAQILVMRVFGEGGGAYDSDYMAAIEDALILGCDSVNLSLGSGNPGFSRSMEYQQVMDSLIESDTVVSFSAGNSGSWADENANGTGYLYGDDVGLHAGGSPGSFSNSFTVASVDNVGSTGNYFTVDGSNYFYADTSSSGYSNKPFTTLASENGGEYSYIIIDGFGTAEDFAALGNVVEGKIIAVSRGTTSFYQKADEAAKAGAVASIIYNNQPGTINMDLSDYSYTAPSVSITQEDGAALKAAATPVKDADGNVLYYEGTMTVSNKVGVNVPDTGSYTMSDFSSWGTPGSLELKPEITAPGGNIYSVNGAVAGGKAYESMSGTSMAAPQVAGMAAVVAQYIRENGLEAKTGKSARQLAISLLMSTAVPLIEADSGNLYSVLKQGAGLANVANAISADSYIMMVDNLSGTAADGKVKAELGDDPKRDGVYSYSFTINNLTDAEKAYTLRSDFFTQDVFPYEGVSYLDTWTTLLNASATYTVDGEIYVPTSKFECDLDHDGDTDADDAQVIIDYVVGKITEIDEIADLDADGSVTSYDAYLLLKSLEVDTVKVPANGKVTVTVTVTLNNKEDLDAKYPKGAYIEGYTYVEPHTTEEGVVAPTHSIPVLGFYGNWSEPAMFDRLSYTEYLYASHNKTPFKMPYTGIAETNNLLIRYPDDNSNYWSIGNPYIIETTYPADRLAISSDTSMYQYRFSLIRNAAALFVYYQDADGKILDITTINEQAISAFYHVNGGSWQNTAYNITMNQKVAGLGLKEGDKFTVGVVAIPEYYEDQLMEEKVDAEGNTVKEMSDEKAAALVESGVLGNGAFLSSTFTVDDTAPVLLQASKDLVTGELTIVAQDNEYISSIQILNGHASKVLMGGLPNQTERNQVCGIVAPLDDSVGEYVTILVTDYAGNEAIYKVYYGGTPEDFSGRMFGFTASAIRGEGQRWVEITPEELYYKNTTDFGGMKDYVPVDQEVYAAEYIDGYVFFATDSTIYVSEQDYMESYQKVADFPENVNAIWDMAYNYQDGKLYALDDTNTIYTVDTVSGAMEKVVTVSVTNPASTNAAHRQLAALGIDDSGNFYTVNHGSGSYSFLYTFTLADVVDGTITDLAPIDNTASGVIVKSLWFTGVGSLAWDHDNDQLYFAVGCGTKNRSDSDNELWILDTATGKASKPNDALNGQFRANVVGLYIVPSESQSVPSDSPVTSIKLSKTELTLMQGASFTLTAEVFPWIAQDKSLTWTSSDENIATVKDGVVTAVAVGTATITATSVSTPSVSATCEVTVTPLPTIHLSGLVYGSDSQPVWAEFDTNNLANYTVAGSAGEYAGGALCGDKLYVHDGSALYAVDPDSFAATSLGSIAQSWQFADAAPMASSIYEVMGNMPMVAPCMNGTYLMTLNPEEGSLSYWNFEKYFSDDPMAVIALAGETIYNGEAAGVYYVMTESGELWMFLLYGDGYCARADLGATGLTLGNVSALGNDKASMFYDTQSGMLVISSYCDGDNAASVYVLDPEELVPAKAGEFAADVWPVTALYQYDRVTDLTVKLDPKAVTLYEGDTVAISSKVILGSTNELIWTSSNTSVATVDENGVITAVGEGEATVTATTVAKNAAGETVSASVAVTVKALTEVSGTVSAQITTASGTSWVDIDLANNMSVTSKKTGATAVTGGGYSDGSIYASDVDLNGSALGTFYQINPSTFAETAGSQCNSSYAPLDTAVVPSCDFTYSEDGSVVYSGTAFDDPLYLSNGQGLYFLKDFEAGSISGWNLSSAYSGLGAIANFGWVSVGYLNSLLETPIANSDETNHAYWILALGADGTLYNLFLAPTYNAANNAITYTIVRAGSLGNVGVAFSDYQKLSMDYVEFSADNYGLLIADGTNGSIYYANLAGTEIVTGKVGTVAGASNITALYNAQASSATTRVSEKLMRRPSGDRCSSAVSMSSTLAEIEAGYAVSVEASVNVNAATGADVAVNAATGSLNAVKVTATKVARPTASVMSAQPSITDNTVSIGVSDDVATNNGKYVVTYDPSVLTFESASVNGDVSGYTVDETAGTVTISFASLTAIEANAEIAKVNFTYEDAYIDTSVTVETSERNDNVAVTGESEAVELTHEVGEHEYVVTDSKEPTCTEDGYKTYTCSKCGDTYTEAVPALGHKEEVRDAKAATCDEAGYTGDAYCTACGELIAKGEVIPALGHDFVKGETVAPTETEEGYTIYKCSHCGITEKRDIVPATGKPSTPSTGDNGILLPALLLLVSAMGITTVCVFKKREQN